ncbi:hypothetical protein ACWGI8_06075 [Streptomyces sp. NPDC054841]
MRLDGSDTALVRPYLVADEERARQWRLTPASPAIFGTRAAAR